MPQYTKYICILKRKAFISKSVSVLYFFLLARGLNKSSIRVAYRSKYKGLFCIDYRERGSHARGVYFTQDTSRMGTTRVKQKEEADKNNSKTVVRNLEGTWVRREKVPNKA